MSNRSVKSVLFSIQLVLITLLTLNGQSLVPSNTNDWLQVTDNPNSGGLDSIQVVFFQVPDDYTSPIYFGICDPETNNVSPDNGTGTTFYYLMGGTGCYTDAQSRVLDYGGGTPSNYNTSGNLIYTYEYNNTFTEQNGSAIGGSPDVTTDGEWAYFPSVYASQGEHVGSYYYFRIVVHASTSNKNAYKLVAYSLMNTSGPVEITEIRAFAYSWCFDINNYDWDFYPFLPDSLDTTFQTNELDIHTNDADNEEYALYDITGNTRDTAVASSGNDWSSDADGGTNYYLNDGTYGTQIGGTWHIQFDHVNAGVAENTTEIWAYDTTDSLLLPIYTQFYQPPPPYRVTTSVTSDPSVANVPGDYSAVTLQIVDSGGNSVPYARDVYVGNPSDTLSLYYYNGGYVSLGAAGADALITTNTDGYYILYCDNTVTETVTLSFTTDGTGGSDRLPATGALGTNETGTVTHYLATANPPTLTSSGTDRPPILMDNTARG